MEEEHSVEEEQRRARAWRPKGLQSFASPSFQSKLSSPRIQSQNPSFAKSAPKMCVSHLPAPSLLAQPAEVPSIAPTTESSNARVGTCNLLMATAPHKDIGGALCVVVWFFFFLMLMMLEECKH